MTDSTLVGTLVERLQSVRILCVGDVMLDRFVYGEVSRISPEAPVPICRVTEESAMLGGAGNVVRNLDALGIGVDFVSVIGDDDAGDEIRALLESLAAVEAVLISDPSRQTTIKDRIIAGVQQLLRVDRESVAPVGAKVARQVFDRAEKALADVDAVVISDYGKGALATDAIRRLIEVARKAGRPVVVDPKGAEFSRYAGAFLVTPNRRQGRATGIRPGGEGVSRCRRRRYFGLRQGRTGDGRHKTAY